jgi:Flp pilus assembly protein TadD/4-amino-4-deoxy-L-arabinose transferase-like glycosyltransferase
LRGGGKVFDRLALVVFFLLVLLRIVYGFQAVDRSPVLDQPLADSVVYVEDARRIASGQLVDEQPFYRAPLYPYVIAPFFAHASIPERAIVLFQVLLGIGVLLLCWSIARKLFGPAAALISLLLVGLFGPLAGFETKILGTTLGIFLGLLALRVLIAAERPWPLLLGGLLVGLAALARPGLLLFGFAAGLLLLFQKDHRRDNRIRGVVAYAFGIMIGIAPATAHNLHAGDFVLISSNGGLTFYDGNHRDNETGLYEPAPLSGLRGNAVDQSQNDRLRASALTGRTLTASESSRFWFEQGLHDLVNDPVHACRLCAMKLIRFLGAYEVADNYSHLVETTQVPSLRLFVVPFPLIFVLALVAWILRGFRRRSELLVLFLAGVGLVTCLLFFVNSRYRSESAPAFAILAGSLAASFSTASRRRRLLGFGLAIPLASLALVPGGAAITKRESVATAQWAGALEREGRFVEAEALYRAASTLDPENAPAWGKWARLTIESGGVEAGIAILDSAVVSGADGPLVRLERGTALIGLGRLDEAEADLRIAQRSDPSDPSIALNLAACLVHRGADEEARAALSNPGLAHDPIALYYRGVVALRAGKDGEAGEILDRSIRAGASDPRPEFLRAVAWLRGGQRERARSWLTTWLGSRGIELQEIENERLLDLLAREPTAERSAFEAADPAAEAAIGEILRGVRKALTPVPSP